MLKIKTKCGIEKSKMLRKKEGVLNKLRLYWFLLVGSIRDVFK